MNTGQYMFDHWTIIAHPHGEESPEAVAVALMQSMNRIKGVKVTESRPAAGDLTKKYPGELTIETQAGELIATLVKGAKHWNDILQDLKAGGFHYNPTGKVWTRQV